MRFIAGLALMALLTPALPAAAADGYGKNLCTKHLAGAPLDCGCAGPLVEAEFDEDEADIVFSVFGMMASVKPEDDMAAIERRFKALEDKHGKAKLDDLGNRSEKLDLDKKCPVK